MGAITAMRCGAQSQPASSGELPWLQLWPLLHITRPLRLVPDGACDYIVSYRYAALMGTAAVSRAGEGHRAGKVRQWAPTCMQPLHILQAI